MYIYTFISIPTHLILDQPQIGNALQGGSTPGVRSAEISLGGSLRLQAEPRDSGTPVGSCLGSLLVKMMRNLGSRARSSRSQPKSECSISAVQYRNYIGCLDGIGTWMDGIWMEYECNMDGIWMNWCVRRSRWKLLGFLQPSLPSVSLVEARKG